MLTLFNTMFGLHPPDKFGHIETCIRAVRNRKANGFTKQQIALDLSSHFSQEIIFFAWTAALILDNS